MIHAPIRHVTYESVKNLSVFLPYGVVDDLVPPDLQTVPFLRALRSARNLALSCPVPNAGHLWFHIEPIEDQTGASAFLAPKLLRFLAMSPIAVEPMMTDTTTVAITMQEGVTPGK
jgi:hypothetical protein